MMTIRQAIRESIEKQKGEVTTIREKYLDTVIDKVTVKQVYGGMRGIKGLVCNTSFVDMDKGLFVRGIPIIEIADRLPEEIFWLLITGSMPDADQLESLQEALKLSSHVPSYVWDVLKAMPDDSHPMVMLSVALLTMERESIFRRKYDAGMRKADYWEATFDEALTILGRLPTIAAAIYRTRFQRGAVIHPNSTLDWGANFAYMLGESKDDSKFKDFVRMYLVLHCDHEGGNVSAFASRTVASALSDLYYSLTAGFNGLAGPLHGLANQECLRFVLMLLDHFGGVPADEPLKEYIWATLNTGHVIPGYGHAVLRATDPRFTAIYEFGRKICPDNDVFKMVDKLFQLVPEILKEQGKASNPWPNVDAGSGALLYYFGMTYFDFYTVMFAVSRAIGICAQTVLARALGAPLIRPKTLTNEMLLKLIKESEKSGKNGAAPAPDAPETAAAPVTKPVRHRTKK
jgi:citrate synthase